MRIAEGNQRLVSDKLQRTMEEPHYTAPPLNHKRLHAKMEGNEAPKSWDSMPPMEGNEAPIDMVM
jgi:hypothetical protein